MSKHCGNNRDEETTEDAKDGNMEDENRKYKNITFENALLSAEVDVFSPPKIFVD